LKHSDIVNKLESDSDIENKFETNTDTVDKFETDSIKHIFISKHYHEKGFQRKIYQVTILMNNLHQVYSKSKDWKAKA
jgi:hypothetical protein